MKSFSQSTNMTQTSHEQNVMYMNRLTQKLNLKALDYEFRALSKLNNAFVSSLAMKLFGWGVKSFI